MKIKDPAPMVQERYYAGYQFMWMVTDEFHRALSAVKRAVQGIKGEEPKLELDVIIHDKFGGFYRGQPPITQPVDQTNKPLLALPYMMASNTDLKAINQTWDLWNPEHDILFVLKDWETEFFGGDGHKVVQFIRNMIHSNMASDAYYKPSMKRGARGKRMLIFVSATDKIPPTLPELKPIHVPLPDEEQLLTIVDRVFDPIEAVYNDTKGKKNPAERKGFLVPKPQRLIIAKSLRGLPDQPSEDTLSLGVIKLRQQYSGREVDNLDDLLDLIETEKGIHVAGIPGLTYVSKDAIQNIQLPGYEKLIRFLQARSQLDPAKAAQHNLKPLQGVTLIGGPGMGKTVMMMLMAKILNRMLLIWNMGESKGGIVGSSEATTRRVINIGQALGALMGLDDIDKGMMGQGGNSYSGDGGTSENMLQMVLTEQSAKDNKAVWCYTLNRVQNVKPELIRPGRMDGVFYVQRPDPVTRHVIAQVHIQKRNFELSPSDDDRLRELCENKMEDWTGAEIEAVVQDTAFDCLYAGKDGLDLDVMTQKVSAVTPMAKQESFAADFAAMERAASQFIKIGRIERDGEASAEEGDARSSRSLL